MAVTDIARSSAALTKMERCGVLPTIIALATTGTCRHRAHSESSMRAKKAKADQGDSDNGFLLVADKSNSIFALALQHFRSSDGGIRNPFEQGADCTCEGKDFACCVT